MFSGFFPEHGLPDRRGETVENEREYPHPVRLRRRFAPDRRADRPQSGDSGQTRPRVLGELTVVPLDSVHRGFWVVEALSIQIRGLPLIR